MSQTIAIRNSMIGGGITVNDTRNITMDNIITAQEILSAGVPGVAGLAGAMTGLPTGHGLTDADIVCVTWATGYRYNCTLSSTGANATTVADGAGDTLPTSGATVLAKQVEIDLAFAGSALAVLSISADQAAVVTLEDAGGVELVKPIAANGAYQWDSGNGESNPMTGDDIIKAHCYSKTATAGNVAILVGYNNA
jgi:hypothetical protein